MAWKIYQVYAAYSATIWNCIEQGEEHDHGVYINHCNGCDNVIDSRDDNVQAFIDKSYLTNPEEKHNYYICSKCGSGNIGFWAGSVCPKCGSFRMATQDSNIYTCQYCDHTIKTRLINNISKKVDVIHCLNRNCSPLFYCNNCGEILRYNEGSEFICPECGKVHNINKEQWNGFSIDISSYDGLHFQSNRCKTNFIKECNSDKRRVKNIVKVYQPTFRRETQEYGFNKRWPEFDDEIKF